jgi:hypothetical protein
VRGSPTEWLGATCTATSCNWLQRRAASPVPLLVWTLEPVLCIRSPVPQARLLLLLLEEEELVLSVLLLLLLLL